jgi:hypothetical protein
MRNRILSIAFAIIGAIILTNTNIQAQPDTHLTANIPFDFYIGNERLAAGEYSIKRLRVNSFVIQNLESKKSVIAVSSFRLGDINYFQTEKLVFNLYNEEYFLSEIWGEPGRLGYGLSKSKKEKHFAREFRAVHKENKPRQIEVAMAIFR